jgi:Tfp pilus assembly protein FimV
VLGLALLLAGLFVSGVLVLLVGGLAPPASQAADPVRPGAGSAGHPVAVVRPGDTLWSVAARHVPSHDAYGMIEEIRRLNRLPDHTIHPGQRLRLPGRR